MELTGRTKGATGAELVAIKFKGEKSRFVVLMNLQKASQSSTNWGSYTLLKVLTRRRIRAHVKKKCSIVSGSVSHLHNGESTIFIFDRK